jgi:hypothetical protein
MAMVSLKLLAALLATLVLAVVGATSAEAAETPHDTNVGGFECYATSTEGRFSGTAVGTGQHPLWGAWAIVVQHSSLDPCFNPVRLGQKCATLTGGTFSLAETSPSRELVSGSFDNLLQAEQADQTNAIAVLQTGPCTDESFSIADGLYNVGPNDPQVGRGTFSATLTHHRRSVFGRCITYAATVSGHVMLIF